MVQDLYRYANEPKIMASTKKASSTGQRRAKSKKKEAPDPLKLAIPQFHGRLDGLRELQEIISPHVAALDISKEGGLGRLIEQGGFSESGVEVMRGIFEPTKNETDVAVEGPSQGEESGDHSPEREKKALGLAAVVSNELEAFQGFVRRMMRGALAPREELLNSSLLTLAVAALENLLALLVTEHLRRFPGLLEDEEKAFSLADLQAIGSIDDARTVLIERRVDNFMRKGIDDWSAWATKTLGTGFDELCIDLDAVREIFQRRHLVVHAGGVVNRMYLERSPLPEETRPELGSYLSTSGDYVISALDEFEVLGDLLLFSAWNKWTKGSDRDLGRTEFESRILELMNARRWKVVHRLCERAVQLDFSASTHLVFKVNRWIALRHLGMFDQEARKEVEVWDTSALATSFVMARAVLLDEDVKALGLMESAVASGELSKRDAETWPLFGDLRMKKKFAKSLARGLKQAEAVEAAAESSSADQPGSGQRLKSNRPRKSVRRPATNVAKKVPKKSKESRSSKNTKSVARKQRAGKSKVS